MAKKNSKKNKLKSKDRFRNSIITNDSVEIKREDMTESDVSISKSNTGRIVSSTKTQSLGNELKLIGIIGFSLFAILTISSFII